MAIIIQEKKEKKNKNKLFIDIWKNPDREHIWKFRLHSPNLKTKMAQKLYKKLTVQPYSLSSQMK